MLLTLVGSGGLGLAWGWLLGIFVGSVRKPVRTALALGAATTLAAAELTVFADRQALLLFLGGAALTLLLHLGWRYELRHRFSKYR